MKLQIESSHAEALVAACPELGFPIEQLKLGNRAVIPFHQLTAMHLAFLRQRYERQGAAQLGKAAQLATLEQAMSCEGRRYEEGELERLVPDIKGLVKLTAKYCHHKQVQPTLEVFLRCSIFRGMDATLTAAENAT